MATVTSELLQEMARRLVEELDPEEVILFGSHAWGTPNPDSDVDLMVVLPDGEPATAEHELRARRCLRGLDVPKDILVQSRSDIERLRGVWASLECQILQEGKVLYAGRPRRPRPELVDQSAA
jgi:uncharacterized protein